MESKVFTYEKLPKNVAELQSCGELASPFATAALTILALAQYVENKDESIAMLNYLKGPQSLSEYELQFLRDRFRGKNYIVNSYFEGSSPQNNYEPAIPYRIRVTDNPHSYDQEGYVKLFIHSSGADSPRPIVLRKKGEQWFLWEQMLLSDIRTPAAQDPWA